MQFLKGILGLVLFCSMILTILQNFPLTEEEILRDQIEYSEKNNETDSANSKEKDLDSVDEFLPLSDFNFFTLVSTPFLHREFSTDYNYLITSISSPPPKI